MTTQPPTYDFFNRLAKIINSGQSRSILLQGNVHDLFHAGRQDAAGKGDYVPLLNFLCEKCVLDGLLLIVYELNGPIRMRSDQDLKKIRDGWIAWKSGLQIEQLVLQSLGDRSKQRQREMLEAEFDATLTDVVGKPTLALEFLRQLTICSRATAQGGRPVIYENLLILIEAADLLLPAGNGDISALDPGDRHRVSIMQDWFSDPGFTNGEDTVVLIAEAGSLVHPRVLKLPQVLTIDIPAPDQSVREHYISSFMESRKQDGLSGKPAPKLWSGIEELAKCTAGLSIHALRQLLLGAAHSGIPLTQKDVFCKVEEFIQSQLGEDVIEFKKPTHTLEQVMGFTRLKDFVRKELIPRFRSSGADALPGAAVAGPIGGGKTFIFEAVASELDLPVMVLKNIRSMWFGQTDVIFERLRRVLECLDKVVIFVDEADTQFGGVGPETHDTERRLTGKVQQMMSDSALRGRVIWLLMTARIHHLSPDIRRPGRVGDLIIPVLDPEGADRREFLKWVLAGADIDAQDEKSREEAIERLDKLTVGYSAADFTSLRSHLKAQRASGPMSMEKVEEIINDHIPPAIQLTRRHQTLQALVNCTRRSLLPDPAADSKTREAWQFEIRELEARGIH